MTQLRDFRHARPTSLEEAVALLAPEGGAPSEELRSGAPASAGARALGPGAADSRARAYAGGTDLLGILKDGVHPDYPETVVSLRAIPGLDHLEETAPGETGLPASASGFAVPGDAAPSPGLRIGALVSLRRLERDPVVRERYPLLAEAAASLAAPQLRNMGTVAGNLCQEPRCWYYRHPEDVFHCARKGGVVCNAFTGENRFHSIFGSVKIGTRPCTGACPGSVAIPEYMDLLRAGDVDGAARLLLESNPLPAVTGRVCPHYCEADCNRGLYDEAVSIRAVERYLGDHILDRAPLFMAPPAVESGRRVAVVGSGPAGLAAAFYLRRAGHHVTVFERQAQSGGMLRYALPAYRLPADVLARAIDGLGRCGVEFRTGVDVGVDIGLADLRRDFDAVFLGPGAWGQPRLGLEHEELLDSGLEFLSTIRAGKRSPVGRRVVVIGGGNVAVDVAVAARRLGAESVTMVCLEACEDMPAFTHEVDQAREEGVAIVDSCGPARIRLDDAGRLAGLELMRCVCVFDDSGRFAPAFDETDTSALDADQVILAIGQRVDLGALAIDGPALEGGRPLVDPRSGETSMTGVYAGGDAVSGPASVIAAMAAGRRAAAAIDAFLTDPASPVESREGPEPHAITLPSPDDAGRTLQSFAPTCVSPSARRLPAESSVEERRIDRPDVPLGLTAEQTAAEADRCFDCGCVAVAPSDLAPALVALGASVTTTRRTIHAEEFFAARRASSTVLAAGELVTEIRVPAPPPTLRSTYVKFRLRQAIDFPILAVACALDLHEGIVAEARVVLGAAAPFPVRARSTEAFLVGKSLDAETIAEAARLSVEDCLPLALNRYKIQVTEALVARALARVAA